MVSAKVAELELEFLTRQPRVEARALALFRGALLQGAAGNGAENDAGIDHLGAKEPRELAESSARVEASAAFLSEHSSAATQLVVDTWLRLWKRLSATFRDGCKVLPPLPGHDHGGDERGGGVGRVYDGSGQGGGQWRDAWKQAIVEQAGDHFRGHGGIFRV